MPWARGVSRCTGGRIRKGEAEFNEARFGSHDEPGEMLAPAAAGSYVPVVRTGNLLYCAGTIAVLNGVQTHVGQVGREQSVETARQAAEVCVLNTLANIRAAVGSLDQVSRIVFVSGYVNAVDGFSESPAVLNGASDLLVKIFGEAGRHARAAVAVNGLPRGTTVEVQVVAEVR
jgi:enamine deaminase RidA (YjgF/YER057c/UK114 family)